MAIKESKPKDKPEGKKFAKNKMLIEDLEILRLSNDSLSTEQQSVTNLLISNLISE